ncbi:DUF4232 domain-containing protein [Saccharopolyspora hattusasensis]|uniref:DUF4232 domain-containing protein n=1 Tax=Saccharopolyspora hattusasensis TaxID=1128679 RepID=UPI003D97084E
MLVNRPRTLGAIAGLLGGALLAGCGQPTAAPAAQDGATQAAGVAPGGSPIQAGSSTSTHSDQQRTDGDDSRQTASTNANRQPTSTNGARQPAGTECSAKDFKVDLNVQPSRPGVLLMAVSNTSQKVCKLNGWAAVAAVDMSGAPHTDVPVQKVEIPGGPTEFSLNPGQTGFAGVLIERGDKADPDTVVATGFNVTLPGAGGPVNANIIGTDGTQTGNGRLYAEFPVKAMKVGTLQPVSQGVTVFD